MTGSLAIIGDIVAGRYVAADLGRTLRSDVQRIAIAPSLEGHEAALLAGLDLGPRLAVVCDASTLEAMGRRVVAAIGTPQLIVLDRPRADEECAALLQDRAASADALVAVGSGTINDLCKYVTHRTGRACAVFGTAPSMDGYVTSVVAISRDGYKLSLPAHAPRGVFLDLSVLRAAPRRMILAGFGDTICRSTAQLDWLLQHLLLDTPYSETPYDLMRADEPALLQSCDMLADGEAAAMLSLTRLLTLSGFGVLATGTSHCGSMGEHAISHCIDMLARPHPGTLHGEQVGVATWTMARLQAAMLSHENPPVLRPLPEPADLDARMGRFAAGCRAAMAAKPYDAAGTARLNARLAERWPAVRERLLGAMLPLATMDAAIERSGMPRTAAELGVDGALYRQAVGHAHELRDRYGFLDLAAQSGALEAFAARET